MPAFTIPPALSGPPPCSFVGSALFPKEVNFIQPPVSIASTITKEAGNENDEKAAYYGCGGLKPGSDIHLGLGRIQTATSLGRRRHRRRCGDRWQRADQPPRIWISWRTTGGVFIHLPGKPPAPFKASRIPEAALRRPSEPLASP